MTTDIFIKATVAVLSALALSAIGYCVAKIKSVIGKQTAIENGMQALLRDRIIQMYNHYSAKHHIPIYARENIEGLHKEYKALGGNGVIAGLVTQLMTLPTDNPQDADREDRSIVE